MSEDQLHPVQPWMELDHFPFAPGRRRIFQPLSLCSFQIMTVTAEYPQETFGLKERSRED